MKYVSNGIFEVMIVSPQIMEFHKERTSRMENTFVSDLKHYWELLMKTGETHFDVRTLFHRVHKRR